MGLGALIVKLKAASKEIEPFVKNGAIVHRLVSGPELNSMSDYVPTSDQVFTKEHSLNRIARAISDQWIQGRYDNEMEDEHAGIIHKRVRQLISAATKDNPAIKRMFDYMFSKKGVRSSEEQVDFAARKEPAKLISEEELQSEEKRKAFKDPLKSDDKTTSLLVKIFKKLDEIKTILGDTSLSGVNASPTTLKQVMGIARGQMLSMMPKQSSKSVQQSTELIAKFLRLHSNLFSRAKPKPGMPMKGAAPTFLSHLKLKDRDVPTEVVNPPICQAIEQAGGGFLGNLFGLFGENGRLKGVAKQLGGLAGKLLPKLARIVGPVAAIGAAGYGGYKAGEWINEKLGAAEDGTVLANIRDAKNNVFNSVLATADKITGGGISGDEEIADQMFRESSVGKGFERVMSWTDEKFTKIRDAAMELWGRGKAAKENITKNIPALMQELEKQGIATTMKQKSMILGQLAHETGGFSQMEEGKYSADTVWKLRGKELEKHGVTKEELQKAEKERGKDSLYEYMYADKYRSGSSKMGNVNEGDAAKFRGRGMIQLTGRANYERASRDLGIDLVNNPDLITQDPEVNAKVTAWFIKNNRTVMRGLEEGDVVRVSQGINGGVYGRAYGLSDRIAKTHAMSIKLAGLEKIPHPVTESSKIENETIVAKQIDKQPIIIAQTAPPPPPSPTLQVGASTPVAPVVPRNTESSIRRITDSQMSYGMS